MRPLLYAVVLTTLAGCATTPAPAPSPRTVVATPQPARCAPPAKRASFATWCDLPADVREFVDDRDACEEFRAAPWPASDSEADRQRRQAIVEGLRTSCAGLETRLVELRRRHSSNAPVAALLAAYQRAK